MRTLSILFCLLLARCFVQISFHSYELFRPVWLAGSTKLNATKKSAKNGWRCDAIPGYERLCNISGSHNQITLKALLTPPDEIPVWQPPEDITPLLRELVTRMFEPYPKITKHDIDLLMEADSCEQSIKFKIHDGIVFVQPPDIETITIRDFASTRRMHPLRNIQSLLLQIPFKLRKKIFSYLEAVVCIGDYPPHGPGFSLIWNTQYQAQQEHLNGQQSQKQPRSGIIMPLMEFNYPLNVFDQSMKETFQWRDAHPWHNRTSKAVFRGGPRTCYPEQGDELAMQDTNNTYPCGRQGLYQVALQHPDLLDVALVEIPTDESYMLMRDQEQFKMMLVVEGHGGWANRLGKMLAMEAVVIRQFNSPFEEWYSAFLEPYVHYVPVDHLFHHLPSVIQWCLNNDEKIQQISENADAYAKTFLTVEVQVQLLQMILEEYTRRFVPPKHLTFKQPTGNHKIEQEWVSIQALERISYAIMPFGYMEFNWTSTEIFSKAARKFVAP